MSTIATGLGNSNLSVFLNNLFKSLSIQFMEENQEFENIDYSFKSLTNEEFYDCNFTACNFTETDLAGTTFEDCIFKDCNFSQINTQGLAFRTVEFKDCKILGVDFSKCNKLTLSFKFENCILDYSTFYGLKAKGTQFINCSLREVDFTDADFNASVFKSSDLARAVFYNTYLSEADFRGAKNLILDPEINRIKKAKFNSSQLEGLLYKHQLDVS